MLKPIEEKHLIDLLKAMREAQKSHNRSHSPTDTATVKRLETAMDLWLANYEAKRLYGDKDAQDD